MCYIRKVLYDRLSVDLVTPLLEKVYILSWMLHARSASINRSTLCIRVVYLRHCMYIRTAACNFIKSVVVHYTETLCSRTNHKTSSKVISPRALKSKL